jgi:hypothetical protein
MLASRSNIKLKEQRKMASEITPLEGRWVNFFSTYWRQVIYGALAIVLLALSAYLFFFNNAHREQNYLKAEIDFQRYLLADSNDNAQFEQLQESFRQSPQLLQKYQGAFAQELTKQGKWDEALTYATAAIERSANIQPLLFEEFSQASLLIGQKEYRQALEISKNLNQILSTLPYEHHYQSGYNLLGAYSLLRIAILQQEIGSPFEELQAWLEYKNFTAKKNLFTNEDNTTSDNLSLLQNNFRAGDVSLNDYIVHRETILKNMLDSR